MVKKVSDDEEDFDPSFEPDNLEEEVDDDSDPILNWECFSESDLSNAKWFVDSDHHIPRSLGYQMKDILDQHAESTNIKLSKYYRKRLVMAGGEYTYLFILPRIMCWLQRKMPKLEITIKMHDVASTSSLKELKKSDCDIVFAGYFEGDEDKWSDWKSAGFFRHKKKFADHVYPAIHKDLVTLHGSVKAATENVDLIFGRCNVEYDDANMIRVYPTPRKGNDIRILTDTYILAFICMAGGLGMWYVYISIPERDIENLVKVTLDHTTTIYRIAFYKRKKRPWVHMAMSRFFYLMERPGLSS